MATSWTWTITEVPLKDRAYIPDGPPHPLFKLSCVDHHGVEWMPNVFCTIEDLEALGEQLNLTMLRLSEAGNG